ncbi:MAG TPA: NAD(P)/FAD-dependent oxidoreductase [Sphingobacterium sp.]|nr:NAD(P)/FAD-dependent oxidoreductase [Sphingobacterium sp.]
MAIKEFDVFVIGTGNAGKNVAFACAEAGLKVAIADNRRYGGTCANRGCDPKKVLVGITEIKQSADHLRGKGLDSNLLINWSDLQKFKATFTDAVPAVHEKRLKNAGVTLYHQSPRFLDENSLSVEGKTVLVKKVVIATGLIPLELKIQGREHLLISDDFLSLSQLPKEMTFVGGGLIGMEFAHVAARCGVKVTIIQSGKLPLEKFDKDLTAQLIEVSDKLGINFILNARVNKVEKLQKNYRVFYKKNGEIKSLVTEMVFNTAGRIPAIESLGLKKGNVAYEKEGVSVNEYLQSPTNSNVYACGDVSASGTEPLTPTSHLESRVVTENILKEKSKTLIIPPTPSVVYTIPQLAKVGLSEEEANAEGYDFTIKYKSIPKWFSAKHKNEEVYAYKVLIDNKSNQILGAHIIASEAGGLINLFAMAMQGKLTANQVKDMVLAYPTRSYEIKGML